MGLGGTGGGGQPGDIQGSDKANAAFGTQMSDLAMQNRYKQLGLGSTGAQPTGYAEGSNAPGPIIGGTSNRSGGMGINPGSGSTPTTNAGFGTGPTAFNMDVGRAPSWTGGIPEEFQAALGEGQFQDLSATTQAAVGAQQAKGQVAQGIGGLIGGI